MVVISLGNGDEVTCTATASMFGLTKSNTRANIPMIRSTATEFINGQMGASIKVSGRMESSMASPSTLLLNNQRLGTLKKSKVAMGSGKPVGALSGSHWIRRKSGRVS